jgi:peroxiredoxin family protein
MDEHEQPLSLVLFSGTDDKLTAASILIAGAAALGARSARRRRRENALDAV